MAGGEEVMAVEFVTEGMAAEPAEGAMVADVAAVAPARSQGFGGDAMGRDGS